MLIYKLIMKNIIFPELNQYSEELLPISNSPRLEASFKGIATLFKRLNLPVDSDSLLEAYPKNYSLALKKLEDRIEDFIEDYLKEPTDYKLIVIFHHIQFWGGRMGKNIYVKNGGFGNNFNSKTYEIIVGKIISLKQGKLPEDLNEMVGLFKSIDQLGVSFSTKHLKFWSLYANQEKIELPVLDSILTIRLLYKCNPTWKDYYPYVKQMQEEAKKRSISVTVLERALYNEFN